MKVQREGDNNHVLASESPEADHNRNAVKAEQVEVGSRRTGAQEKTDTGGAPDVVASRVEMPLPPPEANRESDSSPDRRDNKLELQGTRAHVCVCVNSKVSLHQYRQVTTNQHYQYHSKLLRKAILHHQRY